jgi:hypothetical protein
MQFENPIEKYIKIVEVNSEEIKIDIDSPIRWIRTK